MGLSSSRLKAHELGLALPITVLEALTAHLGQTMQHWIEVDALSINPAAQQHAAFAALPDDVRVFVTDPAALPYLRTALQLHALPAEDVQRVAEALLSLSRG